MIDVFSGAGGMTMGFSRSGFEPIFAVEQNRAAANSYESNFGCHIYKGKIEDVEEFPQAEVLIGGPPCQGFSRLGRHRDDQIRSELNGLWKQYLRVLVGVYPLVFMIENVPEFLSSPQFEGFLEALREDNRLSDFRVDYRVVNAADFGVPQRRRRGIVIGSRIGLPSWPDATHGPKVPNGRGYMTVREAIGDLPEKPTGENLHFGRNVTEKSLQRYAAVPEGGNRFDLARNRPDLLPKCWQNKPTGTTDVFGRLWWDRPALTIRTEFFKPEKGRYLHPSLNRPITHREAARLQTFPDNFQFEGSKSEVARSIGNAVPPMLAEALANEIRQSLFVGAAGFQASSFSSSLG